LSGFPLAIYLPSSGQNGRMKSPRELLEQIIRAETALHLRLVAERNAGRPDIGGKAIDEMIGEVDNGLLMAEKLLVFVKNEDAAAAMLASCNADGEPQAE
jgi:hypothetical protein